MVFKGVCAQLCPALYSMDCSPLGSSVASPQVIFRSYSSRDLPKPGMEPVSLVSLHWTGGFCTTSATWEDHWRGGLDHLGVTSCFLWLSSMNTFSHTCYQPLFFLLVCLLLQGCLSQGPRRQREKYSYLLHTCSCCSLWGNHMGTF